MLSFGAGVQSSTLLLMYFYGELSPMIDFAVFADTQAEPTPTYAFFKKLKELVKDKIEILEVTKGDIIADTFGEARFASIPFFVKNESGDKGMVKRQCTNEYKIQPIIKAIRKRLGYAKGQRVTKHQVNLVLGISTDEMRRMRQSQTQWITNVYPLVFEKQMSRVGCIRYLKSKGIEDVPKSACYMCPFHSDDEWRWLKTNDADSFQKAIDYDSNIRRQGKYKGGCYLHSSLKPLSEVDLQEREDGQGDLFSGFRQECLGYCGS